MGSDKAVSLISLSILERDDIPAMLMIAMAMKTKAKPSTFSMCFSFSCSPIGTPRIRCPSNTFSMYYILDILYINSYPLQQAFKYALGSNFRNRLIGNIALVIYFGYTLAATRTPTSSLEMKPPFISSRFILTV